MQLLLGCTKEFKFLQLLLSVPALHHSGLFLFFLSNLPLYQYSCEGRKMAETPQSPKSSDKKIHVVYK
jgi:hypothetical protein